jgi:hypothetical protein
MKVQIGKLLPDGRVRYIEVFSAEGLKETAAKLKTFYSSDRRLDALLELGNLNYMGSTPYGRYRNINTGPHCYALIRDEKKSPNKHGAQITGNREKFFSTKETCFLFESGKWTVKPQQKDSLSHLTVYAVNDKGISRKWINGLTWRQLIQKAKEENESYYFFGTNEKLVTSILKSQLQ